MQQPTELTQSPKKNHGSKRIILIAGASVVGISTICGLGYAAWAGYLPNPLIQRPTPETFIDALASITSAQTTIDMQFAIEEKEADVQPFDLSLFEEKEGEKTNVTHALLEAIRILPNDLDLHLNLASSFTNSKEETNEETNVTGTYTANNITAHLNIATRSVNGTTYIKPDAIPLPIPLFDMSALEGTWVSMNNAEENRKVFTYTNDSKNVIKQGGNENINPREEIFALLREGVARGAILFSAPERITHNDTRAWKSTAIIDGEKLRETIIALGEERETRFPEQEEFALFTDTFLEATGKERAKDAYREFFKNVTISAITNNESVPVRISLTTRIAPKLENNLLNNRQVALRTTIDLTGINQPIQVSAPENPITTQEALARIMGKTQESVTFDEQYSTIRELRKALEIFYKENQVYPENLEQLIGVESGSQEVTYIPHDIMTGEAYIYKKTEAGYTLTYEMPAPENNQTPNDAKAIEGTNTATESFISEEGAKRIDEDEDDISLYDETMLYNTSDRKEDTDSDGYTDKAEIDAGYNPNGEGILVPQEVVE